MGMLFARWFAWMAAAAVFELCHGFLEKRIRLPLCKHDLFVLFWVVVVGLWFASLGERITGDFFTDSLLFAPVGLAITAHYNLSDVGRGFGRRSRRWRKKGM